MRPLLTPCFVGVAVFAALAISPTTGSKDTLAFLAGRSPLGYGFLFIDGILGAVPMGEMSPVSFFFAAFDLINALLLASSISEKEHGLCQQPK